MTAPDRFTQMALAVEKRVVRENYRGMRDLYAFQQPGNYSRAVRILSEAPGPVLICTGFPVGDTFETDGPPGALALFEILSECNKTPRIVCGDLLYEKLKSIRLCVRIENNDHMIRQEILNKYHPGCVVSIECPGASKDGKFYNMRGEDISEKTSGVDFLIRNAACPTICIGDGGNETGMGNLSSHISDMKIRSSSTPCNELLLADISNWGAYGLAVLFATHTGVSAHNLIRPAACLEELCRMGAVDGITGLPEATEDGKMSDVGEKLFQDLQLMCGLRVPRKPRASSSPKQIPR